MSSLEFLERMRRRQRKRWSAGTDQSRFNRCTLAVNGGDLADESGEPIVFSYVDDPHENREFCKAFDMINTIEAGHFGPCVLPNREAYYAVRPTLQPL